MANPHYPVPDGDWRISFDVVSNVMAISPSPTISALMQSCHALYVEGRRHLLHDGVILFVRGPSRPVYELHAEQKSLTICLWKLELAFSTPFPIVFFDDARHRLSGLLSDPALSLETLILCSTAFLLNSDSLSDATLCQAFARLHTIKQLTVLSVRGQSDPAIRALPSELDSVSIGVDRPLIELPGWPRFEVLSTLRPFSDTLRTLLVKLEPSALALSLLNTVGVEGFPYVHIFGVVYDDSVPVLFASPMFAQIFPALTDLQLIPVMHHRSVQNRRGRLESAVLFREGNQARRVHLGGPTFPGLASLVECSGPLFDVYALALNHPFATLRLWQHVTAEDFPAIRVVLEDTCPGRLCFSTEMDRDDYGQTTFATLRALLAQQPPPRVDLNIPLSSAFWHSLYDEGGLKQFFVLFISVIYPRVPPGLVELHLFVDFPCDALPAGRSVVGEQLEALAR